MSTDMNALIRLLAAGAPASEAPLANDQGVTGQEVDRPLPPPRLPPERLPPSGISQSPREGGRGGWETPTPAPIYVDPRDLPPNPRLVEEYPYDGMSPGSAQDNLEIDPRFIGSVNTNPDGADAGPLYMTPEAEIWFQENIIDQGYYVDWGTGEAFNPNTGDRFKVPTSFPKMM